MSAMPENRAPFELGEVLAATAGELVGTPVATRFSGVGTDTRADLSGKLFVALRGERFDAHDMLGAAANAGAAAAIVERPVPDATLPLIVVPSTLRALGALAHAQRRRFGGKLVAVGGSAGKTTTRAAIGALLELAAPGSVHQVAGNLNNLIGVPLVLLGLESQRYAVIEIGTNAPGEVAAGVAMAEPDVAVLTLIGIEHTEGLGDIDGIEREEGDLLRELPSQSVAVGNADDPRVLRQLVQSSAGRKLGYGFAPDAVIRGVTRTPAGLSAQRLVVQRGDRQSELDVPLLGEAGAYATLAALAVGDALGLDLAKDAKAVARALAGAGEPGRLRPVTLGDGSVVLDDTYNSNPASVLSSLMAAREVAAGGRLLLVLGEMRELGAQSQSEHRRVGEAAAAVGASVLIAVGGESELYVTPAVAAGMDASFARDSAAALELVLQKMQPGDVVLVKASRGVRCERVVEGLVAARGRAA